MKIRIAQPADIDSLVDFNQKMALETEGKNLDNGILRSGVAAVFDDEGKGFYVVCPQYRGSWESSGEFLKEEPTERQKFAIFVTAVTMARSRQKPWW